MNIEIEIDIRANCSSTFHSIVVFFFSSYNLKIYVLFRSTVRDSAVLLDGQTNEKLTCQSKWVSSNEQLTFQF